MKIKFRTDTRSFDFDDVRLKIRDIYNLFDKDINIMRLDTLSEKDQYKSTITILTTILQRYDKTITEDDLIDADWGNSVDYGEILTNLMAEGKSKNGAKGSGE